MSRTSGISWSDGAANFERVLKERDEQPVASSSRSQTAVYDRDPYAYRDRVTGSDDLAAQLPIWRAGAKGDVWSHDIPLPQAPPIGDQSQETSPDGMHLMWPK